MARIIAQGATKAANSAAFAGATGLAARLRHGMRGGGKTALVVGAVYVAVVGSIWTAQTVDRQLKRRQALAELAAMELPDDVVTLLEQELTREIARVVEERIAPLERMVR